MTPKGSPQTATAQPYSFSGWTAPESATLKVIIRKKRSTKRLPSTDEKLLRTHTQHARRAEERSIQYFGSADMRGTTATRGVSP